MKMATAALRLRSPLPAGGPILSDAWKALDASAASQRGPERLPRQWGISASPRVERGWDEGKGLPVGDRQGRELHRGGCTQTVGQSKEGAWRPPHLIPKVEGVSGCKRAGLGLLWPEALWKVHGGGSGDRPSTAQRLLSALLGPGANPCMSVHL